EQVKNIWKRCKVIYLSGYSDLQYLQTALRQGAFDYVMKPADRDAIISLIDRASVEIDRETRELLAIERVKEQFMQGLEVLRNDLFSKLITGMPNDPAFIRDQFNALQLPFDAVAPLRLAIARFDRWPETAATSERAMYICSVV